MVYNENKKGVSTMDVIKVIENKDGSATLELELTKDEIRLLVEKAINDLLRDAVNKEKEEKK